MSSSDHTNLPPGFLESLEGITGFDREGFEKTHKRSVPPVSVRLNPAKQTTGIEYSFPLNARIPWTEMGYYLPVRPLFTLDPLLHAGAYYVQEASSMFLEKAIDATGFREKPITVLDLCAAPGGKSTHLQSLLHPQSVLVCNELIPQRNAILVENMTKWGAANVVVTQNDPADFGKQEDIFDLILVDAPCSGSGLFRRDNHAMQEWSLQAVALCSKRQQRILADVLPTLKPGGFLVYATCSYSAEEDEAMLDWMVESFGFSSISLDWIDGEQGVVISQSHQEKATGYRFFPNKVQGEGLFISLLQKPGDYEEAIPKANPKNTGIALPRLLEPWLISSKESVIYNHKNEIYTIPPDVFNFFETFHKKFYIRKAGVHIAEDMHGKYVPQHALALSPMLQEGHFPIWEVEESIAIRYLQKEPVIPEHLPNGWILVRFKGLPLGWLKNMGNRSNNYYPKEWRIRMTV